MTSQDDPFESPEFLLRRALSHFQNFNALASEFIASDSYTVRTELNRETGLNEIKVKFVRDFPEDLRGFASDAIKNIRDALDQAMSAASFVLTGKRTGRTHFPFGESADDLENSLSRRKAFQCRGVPEELFPAIRYAKPYPHEGDNFRLKLLQKVSGPHKHSVSLALGTAAPFPFSQFAIGDSNTNFVLSVNFPEWDSTKSEAIVATYSGDVKLDMSHAFHIAFDHPELRNIPAAQVLSAWGQRTEWIISGLKNFSADVVAKRK